MIRNRKYAVTVNNVCFDYESRSQKSLILNLVNISVPKKSIYGLLGPSGCGKTTLLKTVIGLLQPSSGEVSLYGFNPRSSESGAPGIGVGYMPQDLCLPQFLTISEVFKYFGNIYLLESDEIQKQMEYFLKLLDLRDSNAKICNLSGGQMRRVSMAIAVFSYPRLLILDEPTAGVDPLLRETIWTFLKTLIKQRDVTIIVTTHYIEEMNFADTVAFMRHGEILKEGHPKEITRELNCTGLEEALLKLCMQQKKTRRKLSLAIGTKRLSTTFGSELHKITVSEPLSKEKRTSNKMKVNLKIIAALIFKTFMTFIRNPALVVATFALPLLVLICTLLCVGTKPSGVHIGWVVDDNRAGLGEQTLTDIRLPYVPSLLLNRLDKNVFTIVKYNNTDEALKDAKKLKIFGFIHFAANFSYAFFEREIFNVERVEESEDIFEAGRVRVVMDAANKMLFQLIERNLFTALELAREDALEEFGLRPFFHKLPIAVSEPIYAPHETKYVTQLTRDYLISLFVIVILGGSVTLSAASVLIDVNDDVYGRAFSAGVKAQHFVAAEVIALFIIVFLSISIAFVVLIWGFGVECKGYSLFAIINAFLLLLSGICVGVCLAVSVRNTIFCHILIIVIFIQTLVFTGTISPLESYPYFVKAVVPLFPSSQVTAMKHIFNYENTDFNSFVLPAYISSICHITLWTFIAYIILKRST